MSYSKIRTACVIILIGLVLQVNITQAASPQTNLMQSGAVTAYDLILAMNTLRVSNGLPALIEHPIVNAVAQNTAEIMAVNRLSWHIGDVRGRIQAAGYGGGATVFATENFAMGKTMTLDRILLAWADFEHMRPATTPAYCHVGAGVATAADGTVYYVLQASYVSSQACGAYEHVAPSPGTPGSGSSPPVPQIIFPVIVATPDETGSIYHTVQTGQSFWSIAIAYKITIQDIEFWNNISRSRPLRVGLQLFIPSSSTEGYATPTPVGMVVPVPPDPDGRIIHVVQAYHTLTTIASAYGVAIRTITALNSIQEDWPLQIEQRLLIYPGDITPSPTPRPLTPIERLTPAADGQYYHTVRIGENLSWIANLYEIPLADLLAWNGLTANSVIQPNQELLLKVTPPATLTPTPGLPTSTPTPSQTMTPNPTNTPQASPTPTETGAATNPDVQPSNTGSWWIGVVLVAAGLVSLGFILNSRKNEELAE